MNSVVERSAEWMSREAKPIRTKRPAGKAMRGSFRLGFCDVAKNLCLKNLFASQANVKMGVQRSINKMPLKRQSSAIRAKAKVIAIPIVLKLKAFFVIGGIVHWCHGHFNSY